LICSDRKLTGGILNISNFEPYTEYFNAKSPHYLGKWFDVDEEMAKEFSLIHQASKKEPIVVKAFGKLHLEINKSILPGFLYTYGV
jgi:hypothetical protein